MRRRYANLDPRHAPHGAGSVFRWAVLDRLTGKRRVAAPGPPAPSVPADLTAIHDRGGALRVTWIGHAAFLATFGGRSVLIDPVFSKRIAWVIPRHGRAGLRPEDLPALDALLVTHNHYDHLDAPSLAALPKEVPAFVPAGLGRWFARRGFTAVTEMTWWDRATAGSLAITFVPSRHWSRRRFGDTNRSAWGGFVIEGSEATLYHAGDSAWFDGFAAIGERFSTIDAALLPIGAYAPAWFMEQQHMNPEQAIDAAVAVRARTMIPMHWGAFQLTDEPLLDPIERMRRAWDFRHPPLALRVLSVGESILLK